MESFQFVAYYFLCRLFEVKLKIKLILVRLRMSSAASAPSSSHFKSEKTHEQLILAVQRYPCL